jgi:transcriptional antiterminator RfaH
VEMRREMAGWGAAKAWARGRSFSNQSTTTENILYHGAPVESASRGTTCKHGGGSVQRWYVAKTKARCEDVVAAILVHRQVDVYLPIAPPSRRADRRATPSEALFPGYVFVRVDLESDAWLSVRSAPGIAYFSGVGDLPLALPDEFIEGIRRSTDRRRDERWRLPYTAGDTVVIQDGLFAGLAAVFEGCLSARGRVRVLLHLVQRLVPSVLDASQLALAS